MTDSLLVEGHYRSFYYENPAGKKTNLMFIMRGLGGDGKDMLNATKRLQEKATGEELLLVYPNGYQHYWNECRKTHQ